MIRTYDEDGQPQMSMKKMMQYLLKEIPLNYKELSGKIDRVAEDLHQMKSDVNHVKAEVHQIASNMKGLRMQVDQNHTTFIRNHEDLDQRLTVLEMAA